MLARTLAAPIVLALGACSASIHLHSDWAEASWLGTEPTTESRTLTIACAPAATAVHATLRTDGTDGSLTLRVVDPAGVERLRQVVERGRSSVEQTLPAQIGTWTLQLDAAAWSGSWSVALEANDTPIEVHVEVAADTPR